MLANTDLLLWAQFLRLLLWKSNSEPVYHVISLGPLCRSTFHCSKCAFGALLLAGAHLHLKKTNCVSFPHLPCVLHGVAAVLNAFQPRVLHTTCSDGPLVLSHEVLKLLKHTAELNPRRLAAPKGDPATGVRSAGGSPCPWCYSEVLALTPK